MARPPLSSIFGVRDERPPLDALFGRSTSRPEVKRLPVSSEWQATASPLIQKRQRPDGTWEHRRTPEAGRAPAVTAAPPAPGVVESYLDTVAEGVKGLPARWREQELRLVDLAQKPFAAIATAAKYAAPPTSPGQALSWVGPHSEKAAPIESVLGETYDTARQATRQQHEAAQERLAEAARGLPAPMAALAEADAELGAMVTEPTNFLVGGVPGKRALAAAAERRALASAPELTAEYTAEELADLAARKRALARLRPEDIERTMPAEPPPVRLGRGLTDEEQLQALGMRASPADARELRRLSLPIGEAPERPALSEIFGPPREPEIPEWLRLAPEEAPRRATVEIPRPEPRGTAVTERGTRIAFDYEVRDASSLVTSHDDVLRPNPAYPPEVQPRERARAASAAQVMRIESQLNPELLGPSPRVSDGAPFIGPDGIVESGNARSIALRRAYAAESPQAEGYRAWLRDQAPRLGLDPAAVDAVPQPVLVRVRRTAVDRPTFAREANESAVSGFSAAERAAADAQLVTPDMLDSLRILEDGSVNLQTNRDFVRSFAAQVAPTEHAAMFDARGQLSLDGERRMQNAILARAYGDPGAVAKLTEHADSNVRAVGSALMREAPRFARLRDGVAAGRLFPLDISEDVASALRKLSTLREEGTKIPDYLAQGSLFGSDMTPEARSLLVLFDANARSGSRVGEILGRYADSVAALGDPAQVRLFGAQAVPSRLELIGAAAPPEQRALLAQAEASYLAGGAPPTSAPGAVLPPPRPGAALPEMGDLPAGRGAGPPLAPGAVQPELHPPSVLTTGTTHAITRAERAAAGLPEVERLAARESPAWQEAKALYEQDPQVARDLAQHVSREPRQLSAVENDLLLHDRMHLTLDYREAVAAEEKALASGDREAAALASIRRRSIEAARTTSDEALDKAGTAWGRAGQARQKLIAEDYSALHLTSRYKAAAGGGEVPAPVRQRFSEISAKLEEAQARAAAAEERAQQLEAGRVVAFEQKQAARAGRGGRRAVSRQALDAENAALTKEFMRVASAQHAGLNPELAAVMARKARNRIQAGVTDLQDLVDQLYTEAKPYLADLEPRDVRDVIAGSGPRAQKAARDAAEKDLPRLRRHARVENALEDVRARLEEPGLDPSVRRRLEAEAERWEGEAAKLGPGRGPSSDAERLAASKKRAGAAVANLKRQLAAGEFPVKGRAPIAADAELIRARAEVVRLRREADSIIAHREAANRSGFEKVMDWTAGWGRFIKLSGVATIQKLAAAAGMRALVFRPIEEFIGAGLSRLPVVKHFAAEAPIGGGGSLSSIAKSYAGFFGRQAREESAALLRGREGGLDLAFGKTHDSATVPRWMEIPGKVHGALKAPAKVSGYQFAMEKQAQKLLAEGKADDLLNPIVQAEMKARAWEYAQREIFMGDNAFVNAFNQGLRDVPGQTKVTKAVKTGGRVLLPIVKVPTNYALELTDYVAGVPKAAARMAGVVRAGSKTAAEVGAARDLGSLVRAGLQEIGPQEAELIMRQLKKGSLGAGMIALGATGIVEGGGYYEPGEHRRPGELQPGEIRIAGMAVPHMLLHHPAIEALQVGAAIHREKEIQDGLVNAFWGVAEQVPFFEEPLRASRTLRSDPSQFFGSIERGMTIQPDVQRLARVLDQRGEHDLAEKILQEAGWKHIEARRRKARGGFLEQLLEEEMLGIPGLRQRVR